MASIHSEQNSRGRSWRVRWRGDDGRQQSRTFRRKSDADLFRAQVETGTVDQAPSPKVPTVGLLVAAWSSARRVSRARTAADASLIARHVAPLADLRVDQIGALRLRQWIAELSDAGLSAETISAALRIVRAVLDAAVDDGHLITNPAARVRAPRVTKPPLDADDVYDASQVERLVDATPERWRALVGLLAYVGPRWSEALGLRRADVDLLRRRIHLGHRVAEEVSGIVTLREGGKTRGSDRIVPLPAVVVDLLAEHLATYPAGRDDLLFTTLAGTTPSRGNFRRQVWQPTVRAAGLPAIATRNLRHTAASLMFAAGLDPLEVARRLGHSRPSITLDTYARLRPDDSRADLSTATYDASLAAARRNTGGTPAAEQWREPSSHAG